jgi:23S rRNA pseudouridine1911/1915/1917 synthase
MILNQTLSFEKSEEMRIDRFLAEHFPTSTRTFCQAAIESGNIVLNGKKCGTKSTKLRKGDSIIVLQLAEASENRVQPDDSVAIDILYEDDELIAVNKPAGQPVHPLTHTELGTLMNGMVARYPELAAIGDQPLMAGALHRIDTGTSGLVLVARTQAAFDHLRDQFAKQTVDKVYYALVEGLVKEPGKLVQELVHGPSSQCKMMDLETWRVEHGKWREPARIFHAETFYKPLEQRHTMTLLEVLIRTGVTHQIRCQLACAGHPIVNDTWYGAKSRANFNRYFLHAYSATVTRNAEGSPQQTFTAPVNHKTWDVGQRNLG